MEQAQTHLEKDTFKELYESGVRRFFSAEVAEKKLPWKDEEWKDPAFVAAVVNYGRKVCNHIFHEQEPKPSLEQAIDWQDAIISEAITLTEGDTDNLEAENIGTMIDDRESLVALYGEFIVLGVLCGIHEHFSCLFL